MASRTISKLARSTRSLATSTCLKYWGSAIVVSRAMTAMTTISSIKVNPRARGRWTECSAFTIACMAGRPGRPPRWWSARRTHPRQAAGHRRVNGSCVAPRSAQLQATAAQMGREGLSAGSRACGDLDRALTARPSPARRAKAGSQASSGSVAIARKAARNPALSMTTPATSGPRTLDRARPIASQENAFWSAAGPLAMRGVWR